MRNFKNLLIGGVSAAVAVIGFSGCESWGHRHEERTMGRVVDDHKIASEVREKLKEEPVFKFSDVDVKAFNGVVQLSGFVNSEEQKQRAAEVAQQVPLVAEVVNSIALKPQIPTTPTGRPYPYQPPPPSPPPRP